MGSLLGRLESREKAAHDRIDRLRAQIDELNEQLAAQELVLSRLIITRETVVEVLTGPDTPDDVAPQAGPGRGDDAVSAVSAVPAAAVAATGTRAAQTAVAAVAAPAVAAAGTVPARTGGMTPQVLPASYQEIMRVLGEADTSGLKAVHVCERLAAGTEKRHVEGMRSKLKRLTARGWLTELGTGAFTLAG